MLYQLDYCQIEQRSIAKSAVHKPVFSPFEQIKNSLRSNNFILNFSPNEH